MAALQAPRQTKDLTSLFQIGLFNQIAASKNAHVDRIPITKGDNDKTPNYHPTSAWVVLERAKPRTCTHIPFYKVVCLIRAAFITAINVQECHSQVQGETRQLRRFPRDERICPGQCSDQIPDRSFSPCRSACRIKPLFSRPIRFNVCFQGQRKGGMDKAGEDSKPCYICLQKRDP